MIENRKTVLIHLAIPFAVWFGLIALLLFPTVHLGFISDAAGYVSDDTAIYAAHPLVPFLEDNDTGHPLVFAWVNGVIWRLFGQSNAVANVSMWVYAAIALTAFQALARRVLARTRAAAWGPWLAPLCLLCSPGFIGNAAYYATAIPTAAFALAMLAAWIAGRRGWMGFWAVMLAFTRITGIVSVAGLAVVDLVLYFWPLRRRGRLDQALIPYLAAPFLLAFYLFIKMVVLGRPLTTYGQATGFLFDHRFFTNQLKLFMEYTLRQPPQGVGLLVWPAAAGFVVSAIQWIKGRDELKLSPVLIYLGLFAVNAPLFLLYGVHTYPAQPGWFLPTVALVILAGVHGLFVLLNKQPAWALLPTALWCLLQWAHADESTLHKLQGNYPILYMTRATAPNSLDSTRCRELNEQAARWIDSSGPRPALLSIYESVIVQSRPSAGFARRPVEKINIATAMRQNTLERYITQVTHGGSTPVLLVHSSWDLRSEQPCVAEILAKYPAFEPAAEFRDGSRWIRIYRWRAR